MTRILVIDDDTGVRTTIRQALECERFDVVEAEDGRKGLAQVTAHEPDVVITDVIMPEIDGIGFILSLRKENRDLRVIAISGGGRICSADYLDAASRLGADRVLAKPFDDDVLVGLVKELTILPAAKTA